MKKAMLIPLFLSLITQTFACGPHWTIEDEYFNLLNYDILLREKSNLSSNNQSEENLNQWFLFFDKKVPLPELNQWVYSAPLYVLDSLQNSKTAPYNILKKKKSKEAIQYLIATRKGNQHSNSTDIWGYSEKTDLDDEILTDFEQLFAQTSNPEIKQRILYQLIRFSRYNGNKPKALDYYYTNETLAHQESAIHYYILDQVAGCLPKSKNPERIELFLQVALHSKDRFESAWRSLQFFDVNFLTEYALNSKEDAEKLIHKIDLDSATVLEKMNAIYEINAQSDYLDHLILNEIQNLNYFLLMRKEHGINYFNLDFKQDNEDPIKVAAAKQNAQQLLNWLNTHNRSANKAAYNQLYKIQLCIGLGKFEEAKQLLTKIDKQAFKTELLESVSLQIKVNELDVNSQKELNEFIEYYTHLFDSNVYDFSYYYDSSYSYYYSENWTPLQDYCRKILATKLNVAQQKARSFLIDNSILDVDFTDTKTLKILQEFYENYPDSEFDKRLLNHPESRKPLDIIYEKLSVNALSVLDLEQFNAYNQKLSKDYKPLYLNESKHITIEIFKTYSIPYIKKEKFQDNDDYLSNYPFLSKVNNKATLIHALETLITMTESEDKADKMWANYILGNFVYNISDYGKNHMLQGYRNRVSTNTRQTKDILKHFNTGDFSGYWLYEQLDNTQINTSSAYYKKAFALTRSAEFKAKLLFLLARNEQDQYYTEVLFNDDFILDGKKIDYHYFYNDTLANKLLDIKKTKYRTNLKQLIQEYSNTNTYKEYYSNCNYLRSYLKN